MDLPPDLAPAEGDPALVDRLDEAVRRFERLHSERLLRRFPDKKEFSRGSQNRVSATRRPGSRGSANRG